MRKLYKKQDLHYRRHGIVRQTFLVLPSDSRSISGPNYPWFSTYNYQGTSINKKKLF